MKSIKLKYIVFAFLIVIAGCRKDEKTERQIIEEPTGDPTIEVVSGVTGLVTDEGNTPISNATVSVYNKEVTTDENGIFYINNEGLKETKSTVHVQKSEFFDGFKTFVPALGQKSFVQIKMIRKGSPNIILSTEGGTVDINGGAGLILPENSFVVKDGGANYTGEVSVFAHWYDPSDPDLGLTMPGNLSGINSKDSEVQLGTYGMIAVELESPTGQDLQLADGSNAILRFPVSNELEPPETIPLWYFDEFDGVWVEEGSATLADGFYLADVTHFSFWNCDVPYPLVNIEGRLLSDGVPITNYLLTITANNLISGHGATDSEGYFRGKVPRGEFLLLTMRQCGETVITEELGILEEDTDLGDLEVEIASFVTTIKGRMIGCDNSPLQSAYGIIKSGEEVKQVITPIADGTDADGTFSAVISGCSNENYTIQFFDPEIIKNTQLTDIPTDLESIDMMDVRICEDPEEFIRVSVDGNFASLMTEADVYFSNDNKLIIRGGSTGGFESFDMDVFTSDIGNFNPSSMSVQGIGGPNNPELRMRCGDHMANEFECSEFNVSITYFQDYVTGIFSGTLVTSPDSLQSSSTEIEEYIIEGSFNIEIDEIITTGEISGRFWFDENGNNTKDADETRAMRRQGVSLNKVSGSELEIFPSYLESFNNEYKFTDLLPGSYIVRVYNREDYEVVIKGAGSEDTNSDFSNNGNFYETDEFEIIESENIQNVDLGFRVPDGMTCGSFSASGCSPNILLVSSFAGGLPPYTVELSDGQTMTSVENPFFYVEQGGYYEMKMRDDAGNVCTIGQNVDGYRNSVSGIIWQEVEDSTPNVFDNGIDITLSDIIVRLLNVDGEIVAQDTTSTNGRYSIREIPQGDYFIEILVPDNMEIIDLETSIDAGNDIDPNTGRSGVFTQEICYYFHEIYGGLRLK